MLLCRRLANRRFVGDVGNEVTVVVLVAEVGDVGDGGERGEECEFDSSVIPACDGWPAGINRKTKSFFGFGSGERA